MTRSSKPRLRFFESAANQQHIQAGDKYLYRQEAPEFRLAIIGTGTIGQEHMRVATLLGQARVHGIFDTAPASMDAAAALFATYSGTPLIRYADLQAVCADPDVDALMICTPNHSHLAVLEAVADCGKPVFLEKPMATTLPDAARIMAIAAAHPRFIQIGLQYRYKAQYVEALQEALVRRTLGDIKTISMSEYRPPFLDKVGQWNKFNAGSGGTLVEKCCHYFDLINLLAGTRPVAVYASGGQAVNFLDFERNGKRSDIADHAFVIIEYGNGLRGSFTLNMFSPNFYEELVIGGEHARLVATEQFNFQQQQPARAQVVVELGEQGASRTIDVGYPQLLEQSGHHGATYFEHVAFVAQLRGESVEAATVSDGFWSVVVAAAAQESMTSGCRVEIAGFLRDQQIQVD